MKKAIICHDCDPFNQESVYVIVCEEDKVNDELKQLERYATDVYQTEVVDVFIKDDVI